MYTAEFRIRWIDASPDTYKRPILSINNQFPAPTFIVERGDTINITVINESQEPTAIHWHGLLQRNTLHMDGVPGVTQCSILPNQSYVYTFSTSNQSGTYWYHSHFSIQYGDGLRGALVIKDPNDPWKKYYNDEDILQLTDWYHTPLYILLKPYLNPGTMDPVPDTGLINGIGQFNCTLSNPCSYYRATIREGTTKRYCIINTSVYATITLTIDQHDMRVIEADGISLDGKKYVRSLRLNPGQRYSVLIIAKQNPASSYWIRAIIHSFVDDSGKYTAPIQPNVRAVLQYINEKNINVSIIIPSMDTFNNDENIIQKSLIDGQIMSDESGLSPINIAENRVPTSEKIKTFIFNSQFRGGRPGHFYFNNATFVHPINTSLLSSLLFDNFEQLTSSWIINIDSDEIIDVIINNIDYGSHPFHLHGHHAWLLASGQARDGYFNESTRINIVYNTINPVYRDTYTVNPFSYIVFRFKADNPGIWMMHCHNDWHLQLGMALVFVESPQKVKDYYFNHNSKSNIPSHCQHHY
ncbi:unnamed protein product [Rotaria sp. Silwood2]|nr:unnamed protein product [Rotaria sp. Silwood2]CAF2869209.1 unnamed protein product [Rotaria sp. Silwood2]CAF3246256.1 unnamed protein product [Rotaria sp. Silwood2]CAF3980485.1 unnamed protein product [Rotaria sp. Silwood2]CAF4186496.1 unnamed protein product [Rotaria sp. Silwood2]